ncbi:MAG: hypothetical protein PHO01_12640 [Desulfotomaculaceae bacterium]|nr:hypothetical protein [Desulfotomaculaceae bacterium]
MRNEKTRCAQRALVRTFFDVVLLSYFITIKAWSQVKFLPPPIELALCPERDGGNQDAVGERFKQV